MTRKQKPPLPTHVPIMSAEFPSTALCEQITTVSKNRLTYHLGMASLDEIKQIDRALIISLALSEERRNTMKVSIRTDFGENNFEMTSERALALIQQAWANSEVSAVSEIAPRRESEVERERGENSQNTDREQAEEPGTETEMEREEYKGFLLVKCQRCGEIRGFCAKDPMSAYKCKCGAWTPLIGLRRARLECECGGKYNYKTNITDKLLEYDCLNCGSPITMELDTKRDAYFTIEARR